MMKIPAPILVTRKKGVWRLLVDDATSVRLGRVRRESTGPELLVRRLAHEVGLRFRVRNKDLPGSPDIANRLRHWAVFVHGCYWHHHPGCKRATTPTRNRAFWEAKFEANRARDQRVVERLAGMGFAVLIVWECELDRDEKEIRRKLRRFLPRAHEGRSAVSSR